MNKPLKILVSDTAPLYPPTWGGPIRIWNLYGNLSFDFDVTYIGIDIRLKAKYAEKRVKENLKEISVPITRLYFPFRKFEQDILKHLSFTLFTYLFMWFDHKFKRILNQQKADILIASHPWSFPCFKKKRGQTLIYDSHNCEYLLIKKILKDNWLKRPVSVLVKIIEGNACKKSDIILICSEDDRRNFVDLYMVTEGKIRFIPNGTNIKKIPLEQEKIKAKEELKIAGRTIFFVGSYYNPNIEAARFIINELAPRLNEYIFLIAGNVKNAFNQTNIPKNVRMFGKVDNRELDKIMAASDIAINPVFDGSGINIKVLDYLSSGLPTVTTPTGARGVGAKNNEVMLICDVDKFADSIKKLFNDAQLYRKLRDNGRKLVEEKFDWRKISGSLSSILTEYVSGERKE